MLKIKLDNKNYKKELKKVKKYIKECDGAGIKFKVNYDSNIKEEYKTNFELIEKAINIKDKKERYSFIYDEVCKFLDNEYITKNLCDFKDNICAYYRSINEFDHKNGCCFSAKRGGLCNNLDLDHCKISSISCKLYSCPLLRNNKINFKMKNFPLIKYFFSIKQKYYIKYSFFKPKSYVMYKLMECRNEK